MTREELDFIGSMNMCDEISNEAYKKIVCHCREQKPETVTEFADRCRECGAKYGKLLKQEPCEDAISRQAVMEHYSTGEIAHCNHVSRNNLLDFIEQLPSVNPQPKTGHWIDTNSEDFEFHRVYKCSECGITEIEYPEGICRFRYCFNCGARMIEPQESEDKG